MEQKVTPALFNGSAVAALCGLMFGLVLHDPWTNHAGGPQIWLTSAAAAERVQPAPDEPPSIAPQLADLDADDIPPAPLPVTRLAPERFDVQPAAAEPVERADAADEVDDGPHPPASALD